MIGKGTIKLIIPILSCLVVGSTFAQDKYSEQQTTVDNAHQPECSMFRFEPDSNFTRKVAIKTNMLYWTGMMPNLKHYSFLPNLEVEWFFRLHWSVSFSGAYSKWGVGSDNFFGVSSWSVEPRYWLKRYEKAEVFIGVYAQAGDFDNQDLHIDEFGNTGDFYGGGLSLGVYIPLGKQWGTELGIRAGYEYTETDIYSRETQHYFRDYTRTGGKWKITGINATVSYRFGKKNK